MTFVYLYEQDAEVRLLGTLISKLNDRTLIDVGAEQGSIAQEMLGAGVDKLHAIDPHPENVRTLRARFAGDSRATIHEYAISDSDGTAELHVATDPRGAPLSFGHTLLERSDTEEIAWGHTLTVDRRSLGSLVDAHDLPEHTGILKIDTEGHDLAVVRGMGSLKAEVVMVEHWTELPRGLGSCPWTTEEMTATLCEKGFSHFAFIVHRGEFVTLKWDDAEVEHGAMGNLIFLHDSVSARLLSDVLDCAGQLAEQAVRVGQIYMQAANDRLALVDELKNAAEARGRALEATTAKLETQSAELVSLRSRSE